MRIGMYAALLLLGTALSAPAISGVPVSTYCEIWVEPDTLEVSDTADVYVIVRDLYAEVIPGLTCDFFSDRGPTDIILGSPDVTDLNGLASARLTTTYEPFFSQSHITVEVEGVVLGPVTISWECRAGVDAGDLPAVPALRRNSPNPFSDVTEIRYAVVADADVRFDIFDVAGRKVRSIAAGPVAVGEHEVVWDGTGDDGVAVPSGIYYVRMSEPAGALPRPITLLR